MTNTSILFDDIKAAERFPFACYAASLSQRRRDHFAVRASRHEFPLTDVERLALQATRRRLSDDDS